MQSVPAEIENSTSKAGERPHLSSLLLPLAFAPTLTLLSLRLGNLLFLLSFLARLLLGLTLSLLALETSDGRVDELHGLWGVMDRALVGLATSGLGLEDSGEGRGEGIQTDSADVCTVDKGAGNGARVALCTSIDATELHKGARFRSSEAGVPHDLVERVAEGVGVSDDVLRRC